MSKNNGKVLQFSNNTSRKRKRYISNWNYYRILFLVSIAINLILSAILYSYTFNN
jgi:hypothetical protein